LSGSGSNRAEEIFAEAIDMASGDRTAFIRVRCGADAGLLSEVRELLAAANDAGDGFLDPNEIRQLTAAGSGLEGSPLEDAFLAEGTRLGGYTIKGVLGSGGMGVVYRAEQERPTRTVALKVIRRGLGTRGILRRFEHEAEVLGRLHHPGIAHIFQAGTARTEIGDQPFIAMELVPGRNLTEYARAVRPGTAERLRIIADVCDAVQHAHRRGIIHRDLKPANILVSDSGQPKVLDFGVARVVNAEVSVTTLRTSIGQLIGTLAYMSPEQVLGDPSDVDTRSDVYSLGVILYELLTGRPPHDLGKRSIPEAARIIREVAPARLSQVRKDLRGDLEVIVSKAMEKDPKRRYQSAADLRDDILRHTRGEPVSARADSALYVLRKGLRRYRVAVAGGAAAVTALIAFSLYAGTQAREQRRLAEAADAARLEAVAQADIAGRASEQLREELDHAQIERGRLEAQSGNLPLASDLLWPAYLRDPSSPHAHWGLWQLYNKAPVFWARRPVTNATGAGFSADGSIVAIGSFTGDIAVLDARTGAEVRRWCALGATSNAIAVYGDPPRVFAGIGHGRLASAGITTGEVVLLDGGASVHTGGVRHVAASPDGTLLASAGGEGRVVLWDGATLLPLHEVPTPQTVPIALAFSPRGERLAVGLADGRTDAVVRVYDLTGGAAVAEHRLQDFRTLWGLTYADNERDVVLAAAGNFITVLNTETGDVARTPAGTAAPVSLFAVEPVSRRTAAQGRYGLALASLADQRLDRVLTISRGSARGVAWNGDDSVALVTTDGLVRSLSTKPDGFLQRVERYKSWVFGLDFSSNGSLLAVGAAYELELVDPADPARRLLFDTPIDGLRSRAVLIDEASGTLYSGNIDGALRAWDVATGDLLAATGEKQAEAFSMLLSPDGRRLYSGHADGVVRVWEPRDLSLVAKWPRGWGRVESMALSRDGTLIATGASEHGVELRDAQSGEPVRSLDTTADCWGVEFLHDRKTLIAGTYDGTIEFFDFRTGEREAVLLAHSRLVTGIGLSPNGDLFATGSEDGRIKIWDAKRRRAVATMEPDQGEIVDVRFDPAGRFLAAASAHGALLLYDLSAVGECIRGNLEHQRQESRERPVAP